MISISNWQKKILEYWQKATESYSTSMAEQGAIPAELFVDPIFIIPIGEVVYHTEEDHKVDDECDMWDGDEFAFDDPNKPLPPLHPNCRCYYIYKDTGDKVFFSGSEWV